MRALERRLARLEKLRPTPETRDTSRDTRMVWGVCGEQAVLATSICRREMRSGALWESVSLDGSKRAITDEELDEWVKTFPIIDGDRPRGVIEIVEYPRARLPLQAIRDLMNDCRPRPTISEIREFYQVTESDLRELFEDYGEPERRIETT